MLDESLRKPDDYQPRYQLKLIWENKEIDCKDRDAISRFSSKFLVSEELITEQLNHWNDLQIRKEKRKRKVCKTIHTTSTSRNKSESEGSNNSSSDEESDEGEHQVIDIIAAEEPSSDEDIDQLLSTVTRSGRKAGTWRSNFCKNDNDKEQENGEESEGDDSEGDADDNSDDDEEKQGHDDDDDDDDGEDDESEDNEKTEEKQYEVTRVTTRSGRKAGTWKRLI